MPENKFLTDLSNISSHSRMSGLDSPGLMVSNWAGLVVFISSEMSGGSLSCRTPRFTEAVAAVV